ncbi:MAG: uroporphyrinogen-III C-methyltransferase [Oscillospiraceae bacterium]
MSEKGRVYLIGAGCGSADLITVRGIRLLSECDVVVYDSLIDTRLLDFAPENAEKIPVGKRCGAKSEKQENINNILIENAKKGRIVGRLKGGDPFVFGRGGEEILALIGQGIEYEVVPGISSSVAAAELAGIPVTHRKVSRGFHVVTAHTAEDMLPQGIELCAKENDTLVFLMGLNRLEELAKALILHGKSGETPAAVISKGCTPEQKTVRGRLADIGRLSAENNILPPAVIIVGDTAAMELSKTVKRPLDNVSVTVGGTKGFSSRLEQRLSELGAAVERITLIGIEEDETAAKKAVLSAAEYDTIIFTSANGAQIFFENMKKHRVDIRRLGGVRFAVIGSGTARELEKHGIFADIIPESYDSESLAMAVINEYGGKKTLVARAKNGSKQLTRLFEEHGVECDDVGIYTAVTVKSEGRMITSDFLVFASSSGVRSFFENGYSVSENVRIIAIGVATSSELKRQGINNHFVADCSDADGIIDKILSVSGKGK